MKITEINSKKTLPTSKQIICDHLEDIMAEVVCMRESDILGDHSTEITYHIEGSDNAAHRYKIDLNITKLEDTEDRI